jgi:AcrR family transcriptional regulator
MDIKKAISEDNPSQKYLQLVETAFELFWRYGIRRVSIEEICQTAGVSKMTFYKYFPNKVQLALYVFEKVYQVSQDRYDEIMAADIPFLEKTKMMIEMKLDATEGFSEEIMKEVYVNPIPEISEYIQMQASEKFAMVMQDFSHAQQKGDIRQDIKIEFILYFMNHMLEMLKDDNFTRLYASTQDLVSELMNFFFYGIMPRSHTKDNPA